MSTKQFSYKPADSAEQYEVFFSDSHQETKERVRQYAMKFTKALFIADDNLPSQYIQGVHDMFGYIEQKTVKISSNTKSIETVQLIWNEMVEYVPDLAIVIGGGTINDLAGFACSTYQRGIKRIIFPTTVLAQVDAAIGGKTGIDYKDVKNAVGSVSYPILTVNLTPFINGLSKKEYISGFSEIVKVAVLYDKGFFQSLLSLSENIEQINDYDLFNILFNAAKIKAQICEEKGNKKIRLLYGHAIAHALEKITSLKHGDAVSIGINIEGAMACVLGIWNKNEWKKQQTLLQNLGLPTHLPSNISLDKLINKMEFYKKLVTKDSLCFVLPKKIGTVANQSTTCLISINKKDVKNYLTKALELIQTF